MPLKITPQDTGVRIAVKVVPGASRNRIMGLLGDALKIAVSAPPQGGAANGAVAELLAKNLGVSIRQIRIVQGHTQPHKQIVIEGITAAMLLERLNLK